MWTAEQILDRYKGVRPSQPAQFGRRVGEKPLPSPPFRTMLAMLLSENR